MKDPKEMRDELLRDIKDMSLNVYDVPEYTDCDCCGEKEEVLEMEESHDGYNLCPMCVEFYCVRCRECRAIYDSDLDYCPVCGTVKR